MNGLTLIQRKDLNTPQVSGLRLALLSIFINDLDEDTDGLLIKFVGDTKLEEITNTLDSRIAMQKESTD